MISVLIVEDHQVTLSGLKAGLSAEPDIEVIGVAVDSDQGFELANELHPQVVLLDLHLPGSRGPRTTVIKRFCELPKSKVVVFSGESRTPFVKAVLNVGAAAYLVKSEGIGKVAETIRQVVSGRSSILSDELVRLSASRETKGQSVLGEENSDDYHRCRVTSANQSVTFKAGKGSIEIFMQPADLLFLAKDGETRANLKMSLSLKYENDRFIWLLNDGLPSSDDEQLLTIRRLFYELTSKGLSESKKIVRSSTTTFNQNNEDKTLAALVLDKQNLVNKLVNRHEELTTAIARDLHDSVVGRRHALEAQNRRRRDCQFK
ncbi:unnamed protein product [Sphagnum jensenii]